MEKCNECIHHKVCGKQFMKNELEPEGFELRCKHFKNKADFVEVVRCGKCKHWKFKRKGVIDNYIGDCHNDNLYCCSSNKPIMRETDFCSYGEKKN